MRTHSWQTTRAKRMAVLGISLAACILPLLGTQAQKTKDESVKISSVSTHASSSGTLVSIAADAPLNRAQTWQDSEGYHVVVPYATPHGSIKTGKGVKLRRVGNSLEILVQTKPGASVTVQPLDNGLSLSVSGKLESRAVSSDEDHGAVDESSEPVEDARSQPRRHSPGSSKTNNETKPAAIDLSILKLSLPADDRTSLPQPAPQSSSQAPYQPSVPYVLAGPSPQLGSTQNSNQEDGTDRIEDGEPEIIVQPQDDGLFASIFSGTSVLVVIALAIFGLFVSRKVRSRHAASGVDSKTSKSKHAEEAGQSDESIQSLLPLGRDGALARTAGSNSPNGVMKERRSTSNLAVATPASLYGAYRIDQEVGKLVLGQAHRMDVLSSRAPDDRRAIETSLIKIFTSSPDEAERRRACEALEEYGCVARQCASLLLAPDAFERTSAARFLGEIKAPSALPFLLEALYDHESIVRNQAVVSIGELKLPRAIGALLDMARQHPDVPGSLVSRALNACSVEGLDFFDAAIAEPALLGGGFTDYSIHEITQLEPASSVEDLPESCDDEALADALAMIQSQDATERSQAVKDLARFQVQSSVAALASVARCDDQPSVRAHAISSLASINHESVFPAVLIGMADESREVRAAAARSLSSLSFDRADAYVRVIETTDAETLPDVARACIHAGIVAQGIDRLASSDRRQAYEAFSIVTLLAKARMPEPILDAVANHPNMDVRLTAVRLLSTIDQPEIFDQLRELAGQEGMAEEVKTALLEAMYKLDQAKPKVEELPTDPEPELASDFEMYDRQDGGDIEREPDSEVETHADEIEL